MHRSPLLSRPWIFAALMLASVVVSPGGWSHEPEKYQSAIEYLLDYVVDSGLTFIRNSERHTGAEAAEHMLKKFRHYQDKIQSPEDFIRLCASKSLITGKPYLVIQKDGTEVRTDEWLTRELVYFRNRRG